MTAHRREATKTDYPTGLNVAWSDRSPAQRARLLSVAGVAVVAAVAGVLHASNPADVMPSNYSTVIDSDQQSDVQPIGDAVSDH